MPNGHLAQSQWRGEIQVNDGVVTWLCIAGVSRLRIRIGVGLGGVPKTAPRWLEDARAGYYNVHLAVGFDGRLPQQAELWPGCNVCFVKRDKRPWAVDCAGVVLAVLLEKLCSFGAEADVGNDNRTALAEEEFHKAQAYACCWVLSRCGPLGLVI